MPVVPKVKREEEPNAGPRTPLRQWKGKSGAAKQVHTTTEEDDDQEPPEDGDQEEAHLEGQES